MPIDRIGTDGIENGAVVPADLSTGAPTWNTSGDVGIGTSSPGARLSATVSGANLVQELIGGSGVYQRLGTASSSFYTVHNGSTDTFMYTQESAALRFGTAATERARINSSGNMQIGGTSDNGRLTVDGSTADNTANSLTVRNSAGTILFQARNNGEFYTGTAASSPYNSTTGSAANAFIAASGILQRSTSSIKYKRDVEDATHGLAEVMQLRPVTYKGKSEADGDTIFGGLIAEEVHDAGLTEFVQYAEDGTPDALAYGNMVSLCIKAIQEQQQMIETLQAKVAALEAK